MVARFWVYIGDKIQGPVDIPSLRKVPGFNLLTQVCVEGEESWRIADEVIEIKSYFLSPPRPNSFAIDAGNTAPKMDLPVPKPVTEELTLPEPNTSWQKMVPMAKAGEPRFEILESGSPKTKEVPVAGPGAALRAVCEICGYKNPRDVNVCMKCGEALKGAPAKEPAQAATPGVPGTPADKPEILKPASVPSPTPSVVPVVTAVTPATSSMVEIPVTKLLGGLTVAALVSAGSFFGVRSWKKHHTPKGLPAMSVQVPAEEAAVEMPSRSTSHASRKGNKRQVRSHASRVSASAAAALPGVSRHPRAASGDASPDTSYRVVSEAAPLKKRFSSPVTSPYAVKRRANQSLWTSQDEQAIRMVQQNRIYGGQRTIGRNVDILMQILRDREYTTAFESGKRIYLYNDMDWSATMKEGPVYEVRLTFSGGREADGSPKKALHFAFSADLERGTVEAGAQDQLRSNTLHAFFDESRIPPEERRGIAKDTEELVLAAQPGSSPLALDTVVRQFAKVYTTAALARVAEAYNLTLVSKKLEHDTHLGSDEPVDAGQAAQSSVLKSQMPTPAVPASEQVKPPVTPLSKSAPVDFRMELGAGRERTFIVRAGSKASVEKVWELITGYDRLKQFMPDMLTSEREGQDGAAVIVHTVCLTRFMVLVFKMNLHLRVIEHPRQHTLEFERIAGEFESLRGSVEVTTDPVTRDTQIAFHATVVPSAASLSWKLEKMAHRLLVPQLEAIRSKAESL